MFAFIACEANHHTWKNKENKAIADIIIGDQQNKWFQWRWSWEKKKKNEQMQDECNNNVLSGNHMKSLKLMTKLSLLGMSLSRLLSP